MEKKKTAHPIVKTLVAKMNNWFRLIKPFYVKKSGSFKIKVLRYEG